MNRTYPNSTIGPRAAHAARPASTLALALALAAGAAHAADCDGDGIPDNLQTYRWQATGPGLWDIALNWSSASGDAPGSDALAVFDANSGLGFPPYFAFLTGSRGVRGLDILNGQTTLNLGGATLEVFGDVPGCRDLLVGGPLGASLDVTGGGLLRATSTTLADVPGTTAYLNLAGGAGQSAFEHLSPLPLDIGQAGDATLTLDSAILRHDGVLVLGDLEGSSGMLKATGSSQIRLAFEAFSQVVIGAAGRGVVQLQDASQFNNNGAASVVLGQLPTGDGELDLFQTPLLQSMPLTNLEVGSLGTGLLRVRQGAMLSTPVSLRAAIGVLDGSTGEARITSGAYWLVEGATLEIAPGGRGLLNVGETAEIESTGGLTAYVDAVIGGSGQILGNVLLPGGEIAPNGQYALTGARQQLHLGGDLAFVAPNPITGRSETGRMTFTLAARDPAVTMSAVVTGSAQLDGTLRVQTAPGIDPIAGDWYPVVEAGALSGAFDAVQSPFRTDGLVAEPRYPGDGNVYVEFTDRGVGASDLTPPVGFMVPGNFTDGKVVDVTGDGFPDLVVLSDNGPGVPGELVVAPNLGNDQTGAWLGFSAAAATYSTVGDQPRSLDIGDMNGDGLPDIVILNAGPATGQIRIRLNNPTQPGDFSTLDSRAITVNGTPIDLVLADINADARLDVVTIFERAVLRGGGGGIQASTDNGTGFDDTDDDTGDDPGSVDTIGKATDPNGVVATSNGEQAGYVYQVPGVAAPAAQPRGQFPLFLTQILPTGRVPANVYTADVNGDGLDDIITSDRRSGTISFARAVAGGPGELFYDDAVSLKATNAGASSTPGPVVAADVNGDGTLDIIFTATDVQGDTGVLAIINLGQGDQDAMLFSQSVRLPGDDTVDATPVGLAVADVNGNGRDDVVVLRTQGSGPSVTVQLAPGSPPCNAADLAQPFGVLDLADISAFVQGFLNQSPSADLAAPYGVWDLADIGAFVTAFVTGCP
ncbi:MAG: VCBS repeat-containing protein [Phycisphaeraceae bacterium]|nr:MAG: VCBS repeat-containing protein [Phycisphaeraceae bacterium]